MIVIAFSINLVAFFYLVGMILSFLEFYQTNRNKWKERMKN
ncbi:hypothetical protein [Sulfoacidibacillus thermotolerans]|nr:hypothetical protein [Sulfoacidibacillus thermotolerans]